MVAEIIRLLIDSYRLNLKDYKELELKMQEFNVLLEQKEKNKKREKSPIQDWASRLDESFEQSLLEFCSYRERAFQDLQLRADREKNLQLQVCSGLRIDNFEIESLKAYISGALANELSHVNDLLREEMAYILGMDTDILCKLTKQLEEIRLEIHRIEGVKKTRNAYGNKPYKDAIYIDHSK